MPYREPFFGTGICTNLVLSVELLSLDLIIYGVCLDWVFVRQISSPNIRIPLLRSNTEAFETAVHVPHLQITYTCKHMVETIKLCLASKCSDIQRYLTAAAAAATAAASAA